MPEGLREISHVTGIELDPVTARIVRPLQPRARIITGDFARTELPASFDLAIGNPPFSDRTVRSDRAYRSLGMRLHDYFIARSVDLLKPGALAAFVTSSGTMDKAERTTREHIAKSADLIAAIRLPEGSFRASAGTDVVVDLLFFRKRKIGDPEGDLSWLDLDEVRPATADEGAIRVNRWFVRHPHFVLGVHALTSGPFGEAYACLPRLGVDLGQALSAAISLLPEAIYDGEPEAIDPDLDDAGDLAAVNLPSDRHVREGSYFFDKAHGLMQVLDGASVAVKVRMPDERQLRTIAAASLDEQKEVWKKHKPSKADPQVSWWSIAQALQKTRMYARHASFDDDLAQAYGIEWVEDLFAPADEDSRYTTNVEAFLGAQHEWMTANLPKKGVIAEATNWGEVKLPPKAERVYGKPTKSDCTAMYLDRDGRVQSVHYRMPAAKKPKGKTASGSDNATDVGEISKPRPDVTRKGAEMIGDYRTDALREALGRAPIEDDTLTALLVLAFAGQNVSVTTGSGGVNYGHSRLAKHAAALFDADGKLAFDMDTLRIAARAMLIDVFSCRENATNSGVVAPVAGEVVGADAFLPNMGTEGFLSCLSRPALEASCKDTPVLPRQRVKDTRAALVEHFKEGQFVHPAALFAPDATKLSEWLASSMKAAEAADEVDQDADGIGDEPFEEKAEAFREAAE